MVLYDRISEEIKSQYISNKVNKQMLRLFLIVECIYCPYLVHVKLIAKQIEHIILNKLYIQMI